MRRLAKLATLLPLVLAALAAPAAPAGSQGQAAPYRVVRTGSREVALTQRISFNGGGRQVSQYGFLVPIPSAIMGLQSDFKVELRPVGGEAKVTLTEKKVDGLVRYYEATAEFDPNGPFARSFVFDVTYTGTVYGQALQRGSPSAPAPALAAAERQRCLAADEYFNFTDPAFKAAVEQGGLIRQAGEDEVGFALRVARAIRAGFKYVDDPTPSDPASEVSAAAVLRKGGSDCAGLSVLFASVMRMNGIPTDLLAGREAREVEGHVRAALFAEGSGWVVVDVTRSLTGAPERTWFGASGQDFVYFNRGIGIPVENRWQPSKTVSSLLRPTTVLAQGSGQGKPFTEVLAVRFQ